MKLKWINSKKARKIKEGSIVISRFNEIVLNSKIKKKYRYRVDNYFRPDWIEFGCYGSVEKTEFAVLEKPYE